MHQMYQQNIYLPCSCKGLMKIKSSFNWYCSLNELGWQNVYRERWIKTRAIDELRAQRTDECHTCLIAMIAQLYKIILYYSYTCVYTFTFCINYYSYSYVCTYHLFHYYSTFPLLLHRDEITLRYMKGLPALQILSRQFYFLKTNLGGVENCQVTRKIWEYKS